MDLGLLIAHIAAMRLFLSTLLAFALLSGAASAASPEGLWLTQKRKVAVELFRCDGEALCGRIVWLAKQRDGDGVLRRDARNPDPALRDRPWCGIVAITGLRRDGDDWVGGRFYNPQDANTYRVRLSPEPSGALSVRAYLGIPAIGRSETWTRLEAAPGGCERDGPG